MTQINMAEPKLAPPDRHFRWISSVTGDKDILDRLDRAMSQFYGTEEGRGGYQHMLSNLAGEELRKESPDYDIAGRLLDLDAEQVLEVGCGDDRLYRHIKQFGYEGDYLGVEVADYVIEANRKTCPEARWMEGSVYDLPVSSGEVDVALSLFVLEHLVYPVRGLEEMLRVVRPGGTLLLVFPDFAVSGRLASQKLGYSAGTARQKLSKGHLIDAIVSLIDSRIRLPRALDNAAEECGPFPVNTRPLCLTEPSYMQPDVDAVYIASSREVKVWAESQGYHVRLPFGQTGRYREVAFMEIEKRIQ